MGCFLKKIYFTFFGLFILGTTIGINVFANHSNEGSFTLQQLLNEAEEGSLEIKETENVYKSIEFEHNSKLGLMMPELLIEGALLSTKYEDESASGNSIYGKAKWNLYRGGKDINQIDKSQFNSRLAKVRLEAVKAKVYRDVFRSYYELLFLLESFDLKRNAIEMNQEQMTLGKVKKNSGFTSSVDVIEFELREATLSSDLKMLTQQIAEKSKELSIILGRNNSDFSNLVKGHLIRDTTMELTKGEVIEHLREKNVTLAAVQTEIQISEKNVEIVKSNFLPSVDFEAAYGKLSSEERIFNGNDNYMFALKISVPIFSGFETLNQVKSAQFRLLAAKAVATRQYLSVAAEVENEFLKLSILNDRLNIEEKNLSKAEEYYKITLGEYRRGIKNSPDMVGASERLLLVKIRNLEYRKEYYLAKLKVYEFISSYPNRYATYDASGLPH